MLQCVKIVFVVVSLVVLVDIIMSVHKVAAGASVINYASTISTASLKLTELVGKFVGRPR